jgi:hypothetical protein
MRMSTRRARSARQPHLAILHHPQQLRLQREARSSISSRKSVPPRRGRPRPLLHRADERAARAKPLSARRLRDRRAVDRHERPPPAAKLMDRARDDLLPVPVSPSTGRAHRSRRRRASAHRPSRGSVKAGPRGLILREPAVAAGAGLRRAAQHVSIVAARRPRVARTSLQARRSAARPRVDGGDRDVRAPPPDRLHSASVGARDARQHATSAPSSRSPTSSPRASDRARRAPQRAEVDHLVSPTATITSPCLGRDTRGAASREQPRTIPSRARARAGDLDESTAPASTVTWRAFTAFVPSISRRGSSHLHR